MGSAQKRRRPQWTARAEPGLSGWAAVELEHRRPPLSMGGCGLGREQAAPRPVLVAPAAAGSLSASAGSRPGKGGSSSSGFKGRRRRPGGRKEGSLGAALHGHGHGVGVPHMHEVTEGAGGIVTRKEPIETDSFLHFRKLSRATLRMSWNGEAKPYSGRPVGGCCGRFKPEGWRWQQQADRVPWVSWKQSQVGCLCWESRGLKSRPWKRGPDPPGLGQSFQIPKLPGGYYRIYTQGN